MKNKNGFVFLETIIVVCILSVMLIVLYSSYSYILLKAEERSTFDSTEYLYRGYQVIQYLKNDSAYYSDGTNSIEVVNYYDPEDFRMKEELRINEIFNKDEYALLKEMFEFGDVTKIVPSDVLCDSAVCHARLRQLKPSLIDYVKTFDTNDVEPYLVLRFDVPSYKVNSNKYSSEEDCKGSETDNSCIRIPYYISFDMEEIR